MKILINLASLTPGGGAWMATLVKLRELRNLESGSEFVLLVREGSGEELLGELDDRFRLREVSLSGTSFPRRMAWENLRYPWIVRGERPDIVYFPSHVMNFVSLFSGPRRVMAVRNAAPFSDEILRASGTYRRWRLRLLRRGTLRSIRRADHVIFVSDHTRRIVARHANFELPDWTVIHHGTPNLPPRKKGRSEILQEVGFPSDRPFILNVSSVVPYKNTVELVEAFAKVRGEIDHVLVLAGNINDAGYHRQLERIIERESLGERVRITGRLDYRTIMDAYRTCDFFVFPSTCENCPMTLIEALACRAAILCSDRGVMPEICGSAAEYFDPDDVDELAGKILGLVRDPRRRRELSQRSGVRAEDFGPRRAARRTLAVLEGRIGTTGSI